MIAMFAIFSTGNCNFASCRAASAPCKAAEQKGKRLNHKPGVAILHESPQFSNNALRVASLISCPPYAAR